MKSNRNSNAAHEVRTLVTSPAEFRMSDDKKEIKVTGYAAVFDEVTQIGNWFREVVRPGAFTDVLKRKDDTQFLINHDGLPLARVGSGTLKLTQDNRGLKMETTLNGEDPDVARIVPKMERGDLTKMSFGFSIYPDGEARWIEQGEEELELREIISVGRLFDVAIVGEPAYEGTEIALRGLEKFRKENPRIDDEAEARSLQRKIKLGLMARNHP